MYAEAMSSATEQDAKKDCSQSFFGDCYVIGRSPRMRKAEGFSNARTAE